LQDGYLALSFGLGKIMESEKRIVENLAPARKYVIVFAASLWGLSVLAAILSFAKRGGKGLAAPLASILAVAILMAIFELTHRCKIRRKWLIQEEGLVLITKWRTETIAWEQIQGAINYKHGLSISWRPSDSRGTGSQEMGCSAFLYLDKKQRDELLAIISEKKGD
jgi:hypothetical protein